MMDLDLKLLSLVEVAVWDHFYDQKWETLSQVVLSSNHPPYFWKIYPKFLLTHLIHLLSELLDKEIEFFWVLDG